MSAVTVVIEKEVQLRDLEERMGETGEVHRDWYGKIECGVNEARKRGECFEKSVN
jgi:hypothetical protein